MPARIAMSSLPSRMSGCMAASMRAAIRACTLEAGHE